MAAAVPLQAADWPHFRGPQRTGVSAETAWVTRWPASGPRQVWKANVGEGYSSVAVKGNRVYTMGNRNGQDTVYCLDAATGKPVWRHSYPCAPGDYGGPRATPAVDGSAVYTLSREGHAFCLNAANGKVIWSKDLKREANAEIPRWGFASSPVVDGGRIYYNVGARGVALDGGGRVVWKTSGGPAGYASPVIYTHNNVRGLALFTGNRLVGMNPVNGKQWWEHPWETTYDVNGADPLFVDGHVFISSNYNRGAALLRLGGARPAVVWENRNMRNHFHTSVRVGGFLYGNDENTLKCIDWRTGQERWRERGLGKGGLIGAGDKLIVLSERGELSVVQATPDRYSVLTRARVISGSAWTQPVLANGFIYCRSHEGDLVCLDVRS